MSTLGLSLTHTKYNLLQTVRVPIAIIGTVVFPTLAFCLFVLPQSVVTANAEYATQAVASMSVFAFMSACLFSIGIDLAEQRTKPWVPYTRTLPAPPLAAIIGLMLTTLTLSVVAIIPLVVVGALFTSATVPPLVFLAALAVLVLTAIPSALIGVLIGVLSGPKAAIAIAQVAMFLLAFGGGLFLPPIMFPDWLDTASKFLPVRQARELVIATATGGEFPLWALLGIAGWTIVLGVLAVVFFRRDEGRRYR